MTDDDKPTVLGRIKDKLVGTKEKWAREGRLLTGTAAARGQRLPPGQRLVKDWPILDLGLQPQTRPDDWQLAVDGAVRHPLRWDWATFRAQPSFEDVSDIHCVTAWSRFDNRWAGVSAQHLLALAQPLPAARHVVLHATDGYTTNLRIEHFAAPDVVLAHSWDGRPLTPEHGGPVRLVVPRFYFWKSAKWLERIEFLIDDAPGFWEVRGYHNEGDPWREQRYD